MQSAPGDNFLQVVQPSAKPAERKHSDISCYRETGPADGDRLPHAHGITSSRGTLAPEIVDIILDCLQNDPITLKQCSLVSYAWAHASAGHLFHSLFWPTCGHHWGGESSCVNRDGCKCYTQPITELLVECVETSDRVCGAVRELNLSLRGQESFDPHVLPRILGLFPRLQDVELRIPRFLESSYSELHQRRAKIRNLTIIIDSLGSSGIPPYLTLLELFEHITELCLRARMSQRLDIPREIRGRGTIVESLELRGYSPYAAWALGLFCANPTTIPLASLKRLVLDDVVGWARYSWLRTFTDAVLRQATSLEELSLRSIPPVFLVPDLTPCVRLRKLAVRGALSIPYRQEDGMLHGLERVLRKTLAVQLHHIVVHLQIVHSRHPPSPPHSLPLLGEEELRTDLRAISWNALEPYVAHCKEFAVLELSISRDVPVSADYCRAVMDDILTKTLSPRCLEKLRLIVA